MKEILGGELEQLFKDLNINAKKTFQSKIKRNDFNQVWELSENDYKTLCNVKDEDWKDEWGWWRSSEGSNIEDYPVHLMKVNNKDMLAYYDEERMDQFIEDFLEPEYVADFKNEDTARKQLAKDYFNEECVYSDFVDYCCEQIGASTERNVCAVAMSLAKLNNMTLGELFTKYQG